MACECELQNTLDVEVTQDTLDVEIGGSAGVLLQAKSVEVTENGTSVVAPDDGFDGLKSVEINTNVPNRFECGYAEFDTKSYNGVEFYKKITKINASCLVTSKTTSLLNMFRGFSSLKEIIGLENWDTSSVINMGWMFSTSGVNEIDISSWDVSNVEDMSAMFYASGIKSVNFSNLDIPSLRSVAQMFLNCYALSILDMSGLDFSKITNVGQIFYGSNVLSTLIGVHTLQDVEDGIKTMIGLKLSIETNFSPLRFSSILALANGLADLTGQTAKTLTISSKSYNNMYNDDDTKPTADVIAERRARIASICAAKNWNFAH